MNEHTERRRLERALGVDPLPSSTPTWRERAERKEFVEGDVVIVPTAAEPKPVAITRGNDAATLVGIGSATISAARCTLLRPVDWEPEERERIVCIKAHNPYGIGYSESSGNLQWWGTYAVRTKWAPAELATPLIPLLRGIEEVKGSTKYSGDDRDGVTGHQNNAAVVPPDTKTRWTHFDYQDKRVKRLEGVSFSDPQFNGVFVNGDGLTARQRRLLDRWTATWFEPVYCKRCGHSRGCMCRRAQ